MHVNNFILIISVDETFWLLGKKANIKKVLM